MNIFESYWEYGSRFTFTKQSFHVEGVNDTSTLLGFVGAQGGFKLLSFIIILSFFVCVCVCVCVCARMCVCV